MLSSTGKVIGAIVAFFAVIMVIMLIGVYGFGWFSRATANYRGGTQAIKGDTPAAVLGRARAAKTILGGETSGHITGQLVLLYNKGLRNNNRLDDYTKRPWRRNPLRAENGD